MGSHQILCPEDLYDAFANVGVQGLADKGIGDRIVAFVNADVAIGVYFDRFDLAQFKGCVGKRQERFLLIFLEIE